MMSLAKIFPPHLAGVLPDYVWLFVSMAKNDIYLEDNYVYIKMKLGNAYCPVVLCKGEIDLLSTVALFRSARMFKSTKSYKLHGGTLLYTRCRECFKGCLISPSHPT